MDLQLGRRKKRRYTFIFLSKPLEEPGRPKRKG
jgi:hypothetical protein